MVSKKMYGFYWATLYSASNRVGNSNTKSVPLFLDHTVYIKVNLSVICSPKLATVFSGSQENLARGILPSPGGLSLISLTNEKT